MKIVFIEKFSIVLVYNAMLAVFQMLLFTCTCCAFLNTKKITLLDIIVRSNSIWDMYYNDKIILLRITGTQVKAFFTVHETQKRLNFLFSNYNLQIFHIDSPQWRHSAVGDPPE